MAIGIMINAVSIFVGGVIGSCVGHQLTDEYKIQLNMIFGLCSIGMGIVSLVNMSAMPAVIFAVIVGTSLGILLRFGNLIDKLGVGLQKLVTVTLPNLNHGLPEEIFLTNLTTVLVLFCASGTGIYGSLEAGMTGDSSVLISKSILDIFTAAIFACNLGFVVSLVAIPQWIVFTILYFAAQFIVPSTTSEMIADFKACGGLLMIAAGFRMLELKKFPTADMIPAMVLVMPFSWIWTNWIAPFLIG